MSRLNDLTNALFREFITHMMGDPRKHHALPAFMCSSPKHRTQWAIWSRMARINIIFVTEGETGNRNAGKAHYIATNAAPLGLKQMARRSTPLC